MTSSLHALLQNKKETCFIEKLIDNLSSSGSDSFNCSLDSSGELSPQTVAASNSSKNKKPSTLNYLQKDYTAAELQGNGNQEIQGR